MKKKPKRPATWGPNPKADAMYPFKGRPLNLEMPPELMETPIPPVTRSPAVREEVTMGELKRRYRR